MAYDYFAGFPIAGQTQEFLVTFASETDLDALAMAQAILATSELDLDHCQEWFKTDFRAGSPHRIWVHADSSNGGGSNCGYSSDESPRIIVGAPAKPIASPVIRDDRARMIFVAELSEILMDFTGYGWDRSSSAGEALSIVLATELHPQGYYGTQQGGPRINEWLNSNRQDWVSTTEGTDKNRISYGCGILFLYYLRYQYGIDYSTIVTTGGSTLAETYAKIFPGDLSNAFGGFSVTLQAHWPQGTKFEVPRDNIFPLLDPGSRAVTLMEQAPSVVDAGAAFGQRVVKRKAGPNCLPRDYTYLTELRRVIGSFQAKARGFLNAGLTWSIGGAPLDVHGQMANATVPVIVTDTALDSPESLPATLTIKYLITDGQNQSALQIQNVDFPGNLSWDIAVNAVETLVPGDNPTTRKTTTSLQLLVYSLDRDWLVDVFRCNPRPVLEIDQSIAAIADWVTVLIDAPDPSPWEIRQLAGILQDCVQNLDAVTSGQIALSSSLSTVLESVRMARVAASANVVQRLTRPYGKPIVTRDAGLLPADNAYKSLR